MKVGQQCFLLICSRSRNKPEFTAVFPQEYTLVSWPVTRISPATVDVPPCLKFKISPEFFLFNSKGILLLEIKTAFLVAESLMPSVLLPAPGLSLLAKAILMSPAK